ncbi:hypothetical protein BTVI_140286 [Pitangus sulphuratus]|nr:hypothetical protein BTVI_140286 [Pitangus sulphuratus]
MSDDHVNIELHLVLAPDDGNAADLTHSVYLSCLMEVSLKESHTTLKMRFRFLEGIQRMMGYTPSDALQKRGKQRGLEVEKISDICRSLFTIPVFYESKATVIFEHAEKLVENIKTFYFQQKYTLPIVAQQCKEEDAEVAALTVDILFPLYGVA